MQVAKKKTKLKILLVILVLFIIFSIYYIFAFINPMVIETCEAKIKSVAQHTLSNSVMSVISNSTIYNDLITFSYNNLGNISLISVNSHQANMLARQISSIAQSNLNNTSSEGIEIHAGAFTGIALFSSSGPLIKLNLSPIGTVSVQFKSEFANAGINQTIHKIYINVLSYIYLVLPTSNPKIETTTEVLITENVIVGEIPSTYLQSSYLDEMLNLVPI